MCEVIEVRRYIVESRKLHALESHRELANVLTWATREGNNVNKNGMGYAGLQTGGEHTDTPESTHSMVMALKCKLSAETHTLAREGFHVSNVPEAICCCLQIC